MPSVRRLMHRVLGGSHESGSTSSAQHTATLSQANSDEDRVPTITRTSDSDLQTSEKPSDADGKSRPSWLTSSSSLAHGRSLSADASTSVKRETSVKRSMAAAFSWLKGEKMGVAWNTLETTLRVVNEGAEGSPFLKLAVSSLLAVIDVVEVVAKNREDYDNLATELTSTLESLQRHLSGFASSSESANVMRILKSIEEETAHISQQKSHGWMRRLAESHNDKEDIIGRYQRIMSLFRQLQTDINLRTWDNTRKLRERDLLRELSPVHDALYNSSFSTTIHRSGCTENTREKVLEDLQEWTEDPKVPKVYWMCGMAGTGKSSIAYSFSDALQSNKRLGGNFCCSRLSATCNKAEDIVPTLSYQLAQYSPAFRTVLCDIIEADPNVAKRDIRSQFRSLIQKPLERVAGALEDGVVVVIDALDECMDTVAVGLFLETALKVAADLPIKFFLTSRPEPLIQDKFRASTSSNTVLHLHDIEESLVANDIGVYLTKALSPINPPPTPSEIEQLAIRSGKLFIYAATVVRYVVPPNDPTVDSTDRLQAVLNTDSTGSTKQYYELNSLYTGILTNALKNSNLEPKEAEQRRTVLWTALCAVRPMSITILATLLNLPEDKVVRSLRPLESLLQVQSGFGVVSALHASFPDYMFDESRSNEFYCDKAQHNEVIANACFSVMKAELRFNICQLETSLLMDAHVTDMEKRVKEHISSTLLYSCRSWAGHLREGAKTEKSYRDLLEFLTERLLFWMEVLNLHGILEDGIEILNSAYGWLAEDQDEALTQVTDATAFVKTTYGSCSHSTPHIYLSSLPFSLKSSSVYINYWKHTHGLLEVEGGVVGGKVRAASAGPQIEAKGDDRALVDGNSNDLAARLDAMFLDTQDKQDKQDNHSFDGVELSKGHGDRVNSVALSRDETLIASASDDQTILVWDARSGQSAAGPFTGHTHRVNTVAFSPDGTRIASGSDDKTICIWDTKSGECVAGPCIGHEGVVNSVAFSDDGTRIASGSNDATIRVWDAQTGQPVGEPFLGHEKWVFSVAYSSDNTRIASGSSDKTVRVWDAQTGQCIVGPFEGHQGVVSSVAFSSDGTRIASCSYDRTVRIWDAHTGEPIGGAFEGHKSSVYSVAFSGDGTHIVSGSRDKFICVWATTQSGGSLVAAFPGHERPVSSVAFSSGGTRLVSSSDDAAIRVWDISFLFEPNGPNPDPNLKPDQPDLKPEPELEADREPDHALGPNHKADPELEPNHEIEPSRELKSNREPDHDHEPNHQGKPELKPTLAFGPTADSEFELRLDGWISYDDFYILFIPLDIRGHIPYPLNPFVIGSKGTTRAKWNTFTSVGYDWVKCYTAGPSA